MSCRLVPAQGYYVSFDRGKAKQIRNISFLPGVELNKVSFLQWYLGIICDPQMPRFSEFWGNWGLGG